MANHGYISREGTQVTFFSLIIALVEVYNSISVPLAFLLAFVGFLTCGRLSFYSPADDSQNLPIPQSGPSTSASKLLLHALAKLRRVRSFRPHLRWTLDLASLSERGATKITHDASLVHPNILPSTSPDRGLVFSFLGYAVDQVHPKRQLGLTLVDIAHLHASREVSSPSPLSSFQEQIALGECGLAWLVLRPHSLNRKASEQEDIIPLCVLKQWFGEERLPEGWWGVGGSQPIKQVGLLEARKRAEDVRKVIHDASQWYLGLPSSFSYSEPVPASRSIPLLYL
ncbi:hypothetical protein K443DRAFT_666604, partial [Laccaria amethystina LaAM-08-1]